MYGMHATHFKSIETSEHRFGCTERSRAEGVVELFGTERFREGFKKRKK